MKLTAPVSLTVNQLISYGLHIGHSKKLTLFLNSWLLKGWRSRYAVLNLRRSILGFLQLHYVISVGVRARRPFWFTCFDHDYLGYVTRYALLTGEALTINSWIFGFLTNFKMIHGHGLNLIRESKKYRFFKKERNFISRFSGLLRLKQKLPFAMFIIRLDDFGLKASIECGSANIVSCSLVDSNSHGGGILIPIPGNDDSLISVLFFLRFITDLIFCYKVKFLKKWKKQVFKSSKNNKVFRYNFYNLLLKNRKLNYKKILLNYKKFFFFESDYSNLSTLERINLVSMKVDITFLQLHGLLPNSDEKRRKYTFYI